MSAPVLSSRPSGLGCIVALALVLVPGVAMSVLGESLPAEEWPFALFWGVIFALPFAFLAFANGGWMPWAVTAVLTVCVWGALIAAVFTTAQEQPGVNFPIVLMMLAAPLIITAGAAIAMHLTRQH